MIRREEKSQVVTKSSLSLLSCLVFCVMESSLFLSASWIGHFRKLYLHQTMTEVSRKINELSENRRSTNQIAFATRQKTQ